MSEPSTIDQQKRAVRKAVLARMAATGAEAAERAARSVAAARLDVLGPLAGRVISIFHSFGAELQTGPLIERLIGEGAAIGLPVVIRKGQPLVFRRWQPGDAMGSGPFGIREPLDSAPELIPEILFVPMVAFDDEGYRLGFGGGFYDRTLQGLRDRGAVAAIGLAYDEQEVEQVPRDPHDQRLDFMLTPSALRRFGE